MTQEELWNEFYSRNRTAWRGNNIIPVSSEFDRALDLGCGNGKTVSTLLDKGLKVTGIDFSDVAIEQCRREYPQAEFVIGSICEMPFDDGSFDLVTAVHVLEHLDDSHLKLAVKEINRVLAPEGTVFIRCFTENDMRSQKRSSSDIFYRFYDIESLKSAFAGFHVISAELKEDRTRFGTTRSRVELLLKR